MHAVLIQSYTARSISMTVSLTVCLVDHMKENLVVPLVFGWAHLTSQSPWI